MRGGLPAECALLCLALRQPPPDDATVRQAIAQVRDWPDLLKGARLHHVLPLMVAGLGTDRLPALWGEICRDRSRDLARSSLMRVAELGRICRALAKAGIPVLALKGIALSQRLYDDPGRRGGGDLDLLVAPAEFWRARQEILALGYEPFEDLALSAEQQAMAQSWIRDVGFHHPMGVRVELHQRLTCDRALLPWTFEDLWRDRLELSQWGTDLFTLSDRHHVVYLCVHGAHHRWERLCWLADLAVMLRSAPLLAQAIEDCAALGVSKPLAHGLWLCHRLLGFDLPPPIRADGKARRWSARFVGQWQKAWTKPPGKLALKLYEYSMAGSWRRGWGQFMLDLRYPMDWSALGLPQQWVWLYPLLRPVLWLGRRIRGAW